MSEVVQSVDPINFTEAASLKVKELIEEEGDNSLSLRVYITGGGCSGFQYAFAFDNEVKEDDMVITKKWCSPFGRFYEFSVLGWC